MLRGFVGPCLGVALVGYMILDKHWWKVLDLHAPSPCLSSDLRRLVASGVIKCDKNLPEKGNDLIRLNSRSLPASLLHRKWAVLPRGQGEAGTRETVFTGHLCVLFMSL